MRSGPVDEQVEVHHDTVSMITRIYQADTEISSKYGDAIRDAIGDAIGDAIRDAIGDIV